MNAKVEREAFVCVSVCTACVCFLTMLEWIVPRLLLCGTLWAEPLRLSE